MEGGGWVGGKGFGLGVGGRVQVVLGEGGRVTDKDIEGHTRWIKIYRDGYGDGRRDRPE